MATAKKDTLEKTEEQVKPPVKDAVYDPETSIGWFEPTLAEARDMSLSRAMANARAEFGEIRKTKEGQIQNRKYMYADHADVLHAIVDVLAKYEIEVTHKVNYREMKRDTWMFIEVTASKFDDERSLEWPIGPVEDKNQTNGANLTYARRYAISALFNLAPDEDTDGQSPDSEDRRDDRGRNDRRDYGRDRRDDDRSNFDQRDERDPDAWREGVGDSDRDGRSGGDGNRSERREEPGAVRSGKIRSEPDKGKGKSAGSDDKAASIAIDSINSSGNKKSCETFWALFKAETKLDPKDTLFLEVKDAYTKRWRMHKAEEDAQKDPLDVGGNGNKPAPEANIDASEDHISPDVALGEIETLLENCTSMVEYDRLLKEKVKLLDAASQFGPDKDTLDGMLEATMDRIERKEREGVTQRVQDVEDDDRRSENRSNAGGFASERF